MYIRIYMSNDVIPQKHGTGCSAQNKVRDDVSQLPWNVADVLHDWIVFLQIKQVYLYMHCHVDVRL